MSLDSSALHFVSVWCFKDKIILSIPSEKENEEERKKESERTGAYVAKCHFANLYFPLLSLWQSLYFRPLSLYKGKGDLFDHLLCKEAVLWLLSLSLSSLVERDRLTHIGMNKKKRWENPIKCSESQFVCPSQVQNQYTAVEGERFKLYLRIRRA